LPHLEHGQSQTLEKWLLLSVLVVVVVVLEEKGKML
jgi:hypothetical protein